MGWTAVQEGRIAMTTHKPSIFGKLIPDSSGNVFPVPFADISVNDLWKYLPLVFADSATRDGAGGSFTVPNNYSAATTDPKVVVRWTATVTTGDVAWDFDYRAGAVGETLDPSSVQESANVDDDAPGTARLMIEAEILLTRANIAAGDLLQFTLFRDGTDGDDDMAEDAHVHDVLFVYSDE